MTNRLKAENIDVRYGDRDILHNLDLALPDGGFTAIIGPNGCGKSTLLRTLSRLTKPHGGYVYLDGKKINSYPTKEVAKLLGLLPQRLLAPENIEVRELVARGRFPHQSLLRQWSPQDEAAVYKAMEDTNILELADQPVNELSGGQSQRVWIAMILAQETPILLLDEPTTFLDITHQIELMELFCNLNNKGRTIIAVLHDLNHASRYANHVIAMKNGRIAASGHPQDILTTQLVKNVFDLDCVILSDPISGRPLIIPGHRPLDEPALCARPSAD